MINQHKKETGLPYIAILIRKALIAIGIIIIVNLSPAHGQDTRQAPPEVIGIIPISLAYEGSIISIIWELQKKDIELIYKDGKWHIHRGRLNANNIKGKVSIVGIVDKDTALEQGMILHGNELVYTTEIK